MDFRTASNILNTLLSIWLDLGLVLILVKFPKFLTPLQRLGLGLWGGAIVLSIAGIWAGGVLTPYSLWYTWVWRLGAGLFLWGLLIRYVRHATANQKQTNILLDYLRARALLPPEE